MEYQFETIIEKFKQQGEKTGWTYIVLDTIATNAINPGVKKSYRVKGKINGIAIRQKAVMPMGDGTFILALDKDLRKQINKKVNEKVAVVLSLDNSEVELNEDLLACLAEDEAAKQFFYSLSKGEQKYFSNWINSAKTAPTKIKRLMAAINALADGKGYALMIRSLKSSS